MICANTERARRKNPLVQWIDRQPNYLLLPAEGGGALLWSSSGPSFLHQLFPTDSSQGAISIYFDSPPSKSIFEKELERMGSLLKNFVCFVGDHGELLADGRRCLACTHPGLRGTVPTSSPEDARATGSDWHPAFANYAAGNL